MGTVFFHIDLDAFFAAVEILDNPSYKDKPLIIGTPGKRSVASTCSYKAREYGVHSAMPMTTALKLCPNAICIPPRMQRYSEKSREVMNIIKSFAPGFLQ
ncbi:MAG: DNA polymerase IV, partial [Spirochaetales bacterium]|nr:DNA polymerase IV [Spirochaetales bacterium]